MANVMKESKLTIESAVVAYLLAITSAAFSFPVIQVIFDFLKLLRFRGLDGSAIISFFVYLHPHPVNAMGKILVVWVFALFPAMLPFVLCIAVARHFKIINWQYFVVFGVLIAAIPCYMFISVLSSGLHFPYLTIEFWEQYIGEVPIYIACGSVAGAVCWLYLRRNFVR